MHHHYDDEDEEERGDSSVSVTSEHLAGWDWILAALTAAFVFLGLTIFAFPALYPAAWSDAAVAAGLRPPTTVLPGIWRVFASVFYLGGTATGNALLPWVGRILGALTAGFAFLFFRVLVMQLVRLRLRTAERREVVQRLAAFAGALFFMCSDPMWCSGQVSTPAGLLTLLALAALFLFIRFLLDGGAASALASMFLSGVLTAETPWGLLLFVFCWYGYLRAFRRGALCEDNPLLDQGAGQSARWMLSFIWLVGVAVGVGVNCASFISLKGLEAAGKAGGDLPLMYLVQWWHSLSGSANPFGFALAFGVCVLPFGLCLYLLPRAVDEERLLPFHVGAVTCFAGVLAYAQLAMLTALWFWNWTSSVRLLSPFFEQLLVLSAAGTVVCVLTIFGTEACCRDLARLQRRHFVQLSQSGRFVLFISVVVVLAAGVLPGRVLKTTREMLKVIDDYAREVVAECGTAKWIFTDGSYDARYELLAAEQKKDLFAISLIAGGSPYAQYLRTRGPLDAEDRLSLGVSAATGLRTWVREKPSRMKDVAVQQGFEMWKRQGLPLPPCSGVLARPDGMDEAVCRQGLERSQKLAKRILDIYAAGGLQKAAGHSVCELFRYAQWRLARLARMRAERADNAGDVKTAGIETKLSEELDDCNSSLQRILADMDHARLMMLRQQTPREGLQLALARADFALAANYARPILKAIKDDPDANFAMAMSYYVQKQWTRAEEHFKVYLTKRTNEPAVWNNLALVYMELQRFNEAEQHAKKALELVPNSAEVKDTLRQIEHARKRASEAKAEKPRKGSK